MATDDTASVPRGECQIDAWGTRADAERSQVATPACGVNDAVELDLQASRIQGSAATVSGLGIGLKWGPGEAVYEAALGALSLGVEGGIAWARNADWHWASDSVGILGLASLALGSEWTINTNVGVVRSLRDRNQAIDFRMAVAWQADERWLLFDEALASSRGRTVSNAGLRWWILPGSFGLDLVASRDAGGGASVSLGFGWYGLRLP